jgi:hypothetical protein
MLAIPTLVQGRQQRFLHSWCDLAAVTNVEARRVVTSFFAGAYRSLEKTSWSVHPEFSAPRGLWPGAVLRVRGRHRVEDGD